MRKPVIILFMTVLAALSARAYDFEVDGVYYNINGGTVEVTYINPTNSSKYGGCQASTVHLSDKVKYRNKTYYVTAIGKNAFRNCTKLMAIDVGDGVRRIEPYAFSGCKNLRTLKIGNSVTTIGDHAFAGCKELKDVTIPEPVTTIDKFAFAYCDKLENVTIGEKVKNIGERVFYKCKNLKTVSSLGTPPPKLNSNSFDNKHYKNVTLMVPSPCVVDVYKPWKIWKQFVNIKPIREYDFEENGIYYNYTGPNAVSVTYKTSEYNSYAGEVNIPSYVQDTYKVCAISEQAFYNCFNLTKVTFPATLTHIDDYAFAGCSQLTRVNFNESLRSIGSNAFIGCSLKELYIENGVVSIGDNAFANNHLEKVSLMCDGYITIGEKCFYNNSGLQELILSPSTVGDYAFFGCKLKNIHVWASAPPTIEEHTFSEYDLTKAKVTVRNLDSENAYKRDDQWKRFNHIQRHHDFENNGINYNITEGNTVAVTRKYLKSEGYTGIVALPQEVDYKDKTYKVTTIGDSAFYTCLGLKKVIIPPTVTMIRYRAFAECYELESVTIPSSVKHISDEAFLSCISMPEIEIGKNVASIGNGAFYNCNFKSINCLATTPPWIYIKTFSSYNATLHVPKGCKQAYEKANIWKNFKIVE